MKNIITRSAAAVLLILLLTTCEQLTGPAEDVEQGDANDYAVDIQRLAISASELATIEGYDNLKLKITEKLPVFSNRGTIKWESSNPDVVWFAQDANGNAVLNANGELELMTVDSVNDIEQNVIIKAYVDNDPSIYASCSVMVYPNYGSTRSWNLGVAPLNTAEYLTSADTNLGQGMTLKGATGGGAYNAALLSPDGQPANGGLIPADAEDPWGYPEYPWVYTIQPVNPVNPDDADWDPYAEGGVAPNGGPRASMNWNATGANPGSSLDAVPADSGWQAGSLRTNGNGRILSIAALQGPFYVEARYTSNGADAAGRWAEIRVGDKEGLRVQGIPIYETNVGGIVSYFYEGTDTVPFVYIEAKGSIRLHEVIIEPTAKHYYGKVPATFTITGEAPLVGETKTYTSSIKPGTLTNPQFAWTITGASAAIVEGTENSGSVKVQCNGTDNFTLNLTVTTTNPNDSTVDTASATPRDVSPNVYRPVTGVSITPAAPTVEVGKTVTLTAALTPANASDPEYLWKVTGGAASGAIDGSSDAETVKISGLAEGNVTVEVTVTTTSPTDETKTTQSSTTTVAVKPAGTGGGGGTNKFWNFSDAAFNALGTFSDTKEIDGLSLIAVSGKDMTIETNSKSLDGISFTHRLKLNGTGKTTERSLVFDVSGPCTVTVYGQSGSSNADRQLVLTPDGTATDEKTMLGASITKAEYTYTGSAATLYLYSKSSGINLYGVKVTY